MAIYHLPTRNDVSAPRFDEDNPRELENYFEELEYLFERYSVYDATERKRSAVRYVSVNVRELWQCAAAWDDHTHSYDDFKAEVYTCYPEVTDPFRYTPRDLDALVTERAQGEMQGVESLGAFYRKFMVISTFLVKRDRLSTLEQTRRFLDALSGDQAVHLQQRLESKYPNALSIKDVLKEAQLLLPQLYSAHATEALASEAPRHPDKRNATMARAPTATASTISHHTSSAPILAVPLTPDTALDPRRNAFSTSMTIPAVASSQAACESPSGHPSITEHTNSRRRESSANVSHHTNIVGSAGLASSVTTVGSPVPPFSPVEELVNRWAASVPPLSGSGVDDESPEMMERKLKALLNKLTMERFDSISDRIVAWVNKSGKEKDGRTLIQLIKLIFEKATDEATFSEMYARLCRKLMEQISPEVQDDGIKNAQGKPFAGGQLFRRYLLNRCREDFERGWVATEEMTTISSAARAAEAQAVKERTKAGGDSEPYSDEDYAAANAKRRRLGLIRFNGELFKSQILTERILHEYIKKLLSNVENPQEEEVEALCMLLWTVGSLLDTVKARAHVDVYFSRMREWTKNKHVNEYMISMLREIFELRERKWVPRNTATAPTTIGQVYAAYSKERVAQEKESYMRQNVRRGSNRDATEVTLPDGWSVAGTGTAHRGGNRDVTEVTLPDGWSIAGTGTARRGGNRDVTEVTLPDGWSIAGTGTAHRGGNRDATEVTLPDGWSVAGTGTARPQQKADLSQFGKINKATAPMTFGPSSIFAGKKVDPKNRDSSMSRTPSTSSNMFSMLQSSDAPVEPSISKSSRPPSRKPSVDLAASGPPEPLQRRKLHLLPRSRPVGEDSKGSTPAVSEGSDDETSGGASALAMGPMSEVDAKGKVEEDVKEFFSLRLLDEAESYFSGLPMEHRHRLVDALVMKCIEMKDPDVSLVSELFIRAREKDLCSGSAFEEGFNWMAELLDDLAVDIPKAWSYFVMLLKGSGLDQDDERLARIAEKTMDPDKLYRLL